MEEKKKLAGYDESKQAEYEEEIRQRYGEKTLRESQQRWGSYSAEKKQQIKDEGQAITLAIVAAMPAGPGSAEAQAGIARWHQHLRYFYEPTDEVLLGLGDLYNDDPRFLATYQSIHPELAPFMREAIRIYVKK